MKRAIRTTLLCMAALSPSAAVAFCDALGSAETVPEKYRALAPIHASAETGWIFAQTQMQERFELDPKALSLLDDIARIFRDQGTMLAIMMPPSRPVIAGQATVDATSGGAVSYDAARAGASFSRMVDMVNRTGIIMPDLQAIVLNDDRLREAYYFKRDTHWTPVGAAASAIILSRAVAQRDPDAFPEAGSVRPEMGAGAETIEEPGSLTRVVAEICAVTPEAEVAPIPSYPAAPGASLFGDAPDRPRIALLGTSFSNGRQQDAYRVSDALAGAFQADVENYSVSGGGMIAPVEVFQKAGGVAASGADLVVWEVPVTDTFGDHDAFRQVLGTLLLPGATPAGPDVPLDDSGRQALEPVTAGDLLVVRTPRGTPDGLTFELTFASGETEAISLSRKGHFPAEWRLNQAAASLADLQSKEITGIAVLFDPAVVGEGASVQVMSAPGAASLDGAEGG